jgi:hypothetical protein
MSLMKLLTVSRSFVTGQIPTGRYRMVGRHGGLPQFSPATRSSDAPAARRATKVPVPCQGELPKLGAQEIPAGLRPASPALPAAAQLHPATPVAVAKDLEVPVPVQARADRPSEGDFRLEPEKTVLPGAQGSLGQNAGLQTRRGSPCPVAHSPAEAPAADRRGGDTSPAPSCSWPKACQSPFAKSNPTEPVAHSRTPKRAGPLQKVLQGLRDWMRPKPGSNSRSPFVGKPVRSPVQAHLKLESVQVIRNDLSDSDYEVRQAGLAAGTAAANAPLLGRAKLSLLATSWHQATARWLESGRARVQSR